MSVDVRNVGAGIYATTITSGSSIAASKAQPAVGDRVEFDFDSNRRNTARGAYPIPAMFIQDGQVSAVVVDALGNQVASGSAICEVK